jgi:hypothetical protein
MHQPEYRRCQECGQPFTRQPRRSAAQWAKQTSCTTACANAQRNRGRPRQPGDLSRRELGSKTAYQVAWQRRQAMPRWAAWWEQQRAKQDLDELATPLITYGRAAQRLSARPQPRHWMAGTCAGLGCDAAVVSSQRGRWASAPHTYCAQCERKRGNHKHRAAGYGVAWEHIDRRQVFANDNHTCQICGSKTRGQYPALLSPTIDHIVPMSQGGPHLHHNVQTAHWICNVMKGAGAANDQLRLV